MPISLRALLAPSPGDASLWRTRLSDAGFTLIPCDRADAGCEVALVIARQPSELQEVLRSELPVIVLASDLDARELQALWRAGVFEVWDGREVGALRDALHRALVRNSERDDHRRLGSDLERYRRFFETGPVVVFRWLAREGWPVEYVSPNVHALFGVSAEDFTTGRVPYASIVHSSDLERVASEVREASEKGARGFDQEYRFVRPGGEVRWLFDHTVVTRDGAGRVTHYEGYVIDQTDHKDAQLAREEMQRQLLHSQKMESLGVMAGGVAHDFNNLLTSILGNAGLAMQDLAQGEPAHASILHIVQTSERAADLARQMLAYAGRCRLERRLLDLTTLVRDLESLLTSLVSKKVKLELELSDDLPVVEGDPAQLQQVLLNLVINGAEACQDRPGRVRVTTRKEWRHESAEAERQPWVVLEVTDDGVGMDEATRQRIFDPFYTTKLQGRGLGLSAVQGIVRAHGGRIEVDTQQGNGTCFRVYLRGELHVRPEIEEARSLSEHRTAGLVLLVDDEPAVRQVATRILHFHGYEVITASDGQQGTEIFRARHDEIGAVLLDRTMPTFDGLETLAALRAIRPDVPVVLTSGYDESEIAGQLCEHPPTLFVAKPYSLETLIDAVSRAFELAAARV